MQFKNSDEVNVAKFESNSVVSFAKKQSISLESTHVDFPLLRSAIVDELSKKRSEDEKELKLVCEYTPTLYLFHAVPFRLSPKEFKQRISKPKQAEEPSRRLDEDLSENTFPFSIEDVSNGILTLGVNLGSFIANLEATLGPELQTLRINVPAICERLVLATAGEVIDGWSLCVEAQSVDLVNVGQILLSLSTVHPEITDSVLLLLFEPLESLWNEIEDWNDLFDLELLFSSAQSNIINDLLFIPSVETSVLSLAPYIAPALSFVQSEHSPPSCLAIDNQIVGAKFDGRVCGGRGSLIVEGNINEHSVRPVVLLLLMVLLTVLTID